MNQFESILDLCIVVTQNLYVKCLLVGLHFWTTFRVYGSAKKGISSSCGVRFLNYVLFSGCVLVRSTCLITNGFRFLFEDSNNNNIILNL